MKDRDTIPQDQEQSDIQAVQHYIKSHSPTSILDIVSEKPGPTSDNELSIVGLTRRKQVRRIIDGLDYCGCVNYVSDDYIEWRGH